MNGTPVHPDQRFTRGRPCPICNGYRELPQGRSERCWGYLSDDGEWAYCTRPEHAGSLKPQSNETYKHRLASNCWCSVSHSPPLISVSVEATYEYRDAEGHMVFQVLREHGKRFRQRRPDGIGGWTYDLKGVSRPLPLYRLPELMQTPPETPVFVVEGEKDVDRLFYLGLVATTSAMGAGKFKYADPTPLQGRHVVVVPDNDSAGSAHSQDVAQRLARIAASIRFLELPKLSEGGDVSNWLDAGGTAEGLLGMADNLTPLKPEEQSVDVSSITTDINLKFWTASEISQEMPESPEEVAYGIFKGSVTELVGKIKAAGKTTLLTHMARRIVAGEPFLGKPTIQSPVVYLTESGRIPFLAALRRADLLEREDFFILYWHSTFGIPWEEVAKAAISKAKKLGAVLIVDTLPQFAAIRGDGENSSGEALAAIARLQQAAADGLAVVVVRHERKSGGEVGDSGRGSSAFGGAVDTIISIRRGEGNTGQSIRVLHAISRFDGVPAQLMIELTDEGYIALGSETDVARQKAYEYLLDAAPTSEEDALKVEEINQGTDFRRTVAKKVARELASRGLLNLTGEGKKGSPYRFWRPGMHSAAHRGEVPTESLWDPRYEPAASNSMNTNILSVGTPSLIPTGRTPGGKPEGVEVPIERG